MPEGMCELHGLEHEPWLCPACHLIADVDDEIKDLKA